MNTVVSTRLKVLLGGTTLVAGLVSAWYLLGKERQRPAAVATTARAVESRQLEGKWRVVEVQRDNDSSPAWLTRTPGGYCTFDDGRFSCPAVLPAGMKIRFWHDPTATPKAIDLTIDVPGEPATKPTIPGIYSFERGQLWLRIRFREMGKEPKRPVDFSTHDDLDVLLKLEPVEPNAAPPDTPADVLGTILYEAKQPGVAPVALDALAVRAVALAKTCPETEEGVVALLWVLANRSKSEAGRSALTLIQDGRLSFATIPTLARCLGTRRGDIGPGGMPNEILQKLAPYLLTHIRRQPEVPKSAEVLSSVIGAWWPSDSLQTPSAVAEASAMIMDRWVGSPDLAHFVEILGRDDVAWAGKFEDELRTIIAKSPHARIRFQAQFALATTVNNAGEARQNEARTLYQQLIQEYDPKQIERSWAGVTDQLHRQAKDELEGLQVRGVGGPAPALDGLDLDGKPMTLAGYRGKVVLVSFWATWCGPCMKLIPHERELHQRYNGKPFAIVGVNGDKIEEFDRKRFGKDPLPWRSLQNTRAGRKSITDEWKIQSWPTLFLIDQEGVIRHRWIGTPPTEQFDAEIERLINQTTDNKTAPIDPSAPKKGQGPVTSPK